MLVDIVDLDKEYMISLMRVPYARQVTDIKEVDRYFSNGEYTYKLMYVYVNSVQYVASGGRVITSYSEDWMDTGSIWGKSGDGRKLYRYMDNHFKMVLRNQIIESVLDGI